MAFCIRQANDLPVHNTLRTQSLWLFAEYRERRRVMIQRRDAYAAS
ncbi:MAG: hypothetical protein U0573_12065 [Phycisphaerales bacterium]